jgi:flagellin-specific chaperone FliS
MAARERAIAISTCRAASRGASPHRLVAILFEELIRAIETAQAADRQVDRGKRAERQAARYRSSTR